MAHSPMAMHHFGSGICSHSLTMGSADFLLTGPLTSRTSHCRGLDLKKTPNLSDEVRILPSVEYGGGPGTPKTMPYEQWEKLSVRSQIRTDSAPNPPSSHLWLTWCQDHAKHICRYVKCEPGVWPPGAGVSQVQHSRSLPGSSNSLIESACRFR